MLDDKQTLQIMFLSLTPGCTNWTMQGMTWLRPYARLVRLPNLPTPLADIALAGLAVDALPRRWPAFVLLLLASACLYMAGMVWNDFFDVEQDARERPERPIPSRQISRRSAGVLGAALLSAGVLLALVAGGVLVQAGAVLQAGAVEVIPTLRSAVGFHWNRQRGHSRSIRTVRRSQRSLKQAATWKADFPTQNGLGI